MRFCLRIYRQKDIALDRYIVAIISMMRLLCSEKWRPSMHATLNYKNCHRPFSRISNMVSREIPAWFLWVLFCNTRFFLSILRLGLMTSHSSTLDVFYCSQFDCLIEVVETWSNADYYVPKLRRLRTRLMERGAAAFQPDPSHFNTLIQGDLYVQLSQLINLFSRPTNFLLIFRFQMDE